MIPIISAIYHNYISTLAIKCILLPKFENKTKPYIHGLNQMLQCIITIQTRGKI